MDAATVETPALAQPLTPPATPAPAPAPITLERLLAPDTLMRAWERVQRNGGAAGCDHQTIAAFGRKRPPNALLARGWIQVQAVVGAAGCQRWGSREEMSACLVVGRRVMTSRRYA